jgi:hypothetical protein
MRGKKENERPAHHCPRQCLFYFIGRRPNRCVTIAGLQSRDQRAQRAF